MVVKKGEDLISHENTLKVKSQSTEWSEWAADSILDKKWKVNRVVRGGDEFDCL